jgi:hypothetical protein
MHLRLFGSTAQEENTEHQEEDSDDEHTDPDGAKQHELAIVGGADDAHVSDEARDAIGHASAVHSLHCE